MSTILFQPPPLLRNPHLQTIGVKLVHDTADVTYTRTRLETPDGDFFDMDVPHFADLPLLQDNAPILLGIHGLEGDARREYMCATYREMWRVGIRPIGFNFRGCSGELNRFAHSYHLGATHDIPIALAWIRQQYPNVPIAMMGFSLGGNVSLKFAGENAEKLQGQISAIIAVSPPFDLRGKSKLAVFPSTIYAHYLLQALQAKAKAKAHLINQAGGNAELGMTAKRLRDYDEHVIAPINGFNGADDYYEKTSCWQFLAQIAIPTLIIRSQDDPFFFDDVPRSIIQANPNIRLLLTEYGGHCGFIQNLNPKSQRVWAQSTAAQWLKPIIS
jgi:uncharacterized protein